jgi:hypothetical protein
MLVFLASCSFFTTTVLPDVGTLPFEPWIVNTTGCVLEAEPSFGGWNESWDDSDNQNYCLLNDNSIFIQQDVLVIDGVYGTSSISDFWTNVSYVQQTGNIREVLIQFEYYFPSLNGVCIPNVVNPNTGLYSSKQLVLIGNGETNLGEKDAFNVALYQLNGDIVCDQWNTFSFPVKDFVNDFGSSFSGQSKDIGSFGFEMRNVYVRNINITGDTQALVLW